MNILLNSSKIISKFNKDSVISETLTGKSVRVAVLQMAPIVMINRYANGSIKDIYGYLAELWQILEDQLKFRTILVDSGKEFVGTYNNGTWNGIFGLLQRKEADIGLVPFGITLERLNVADFSSAIDFGCSQFLIFSRKNLELVNWMTFITTFSWQLWLLVGLFWISASLTLAFASRKESNDSCFDYFFNLFGIITMQGPKVTPYGLQSRVIFISYWLMCVLLYASYTAILTTELTTSTFKPMSTLREALDSGYQVSVTKGSIQQETILEFADVNMEFKKIKNMQKTNPELIVTSLQLGIESTFDKKTMFFAASKVTDLEASKNCSFSILSETFSHGYSHLAYRKEFNYRELIDRKITLLLSSGIIRKVQNEWLRRRVECETLDEGVISLGLTKTLFAFAVVIFGAVTSVILVFIELIRSKLLSKKIRNHPKKCHTLYRKNQSIKY